MVFLGADLPGSASPRVGVNKPSAKQSKRFLLLFLEKEEESRPIGLASVHWWFSGGARPPDPPGSASPRVGSTNLLRSRTNAFCFFFWKKKNTIQSIGLVSVHWWFFWGTWGRLSRELGQLTFCEAEQTLFASFSGKRGTPYCNVLIYMYNILNISRHILGFQYIS
jgi:hypothetical protein